MLMCSRQFFLQVAVNLDARPMHMTGLRRILQHQWGQTIDGFALRRRQPSGDKRLSENRLKPLQMTYLIH